MTGVRSGDVAGGAPSTPPSGRHRRLFRYGRWQLSDYLIERGASTMVLGAVLVLVPVLFGGPQARATSRFLFAGNAGNFALLGTLFALNGISSIDRQRNYFRFLFAKPVSVAWYYAQDFALRFAGLLAIAVALFGGFALLTGSRFPAWAVAHVALTYVLVGGVGFLLSSLTHHDGIALVAVYVGTSLVRAGGALLGWIGRGPAELLQFVATAAPPFHLLDTARDSFAAGRAPASGALIWILAYGLACLTAGLVVLRHRPLST